MTMLQATARQVHRCRSRHRQRPATALRRVGALLAMAALWTSGAAAAPNILLIIADDLGYGDLASYGHPVIATPHLDALAASGLRLTEYYAPSALCSPSRAGLLTGRHPYRSGIRSWIPPASGVYLRAEERTLAEVLGDAGYQTALIGKWHLNSDLGNAQEPQPQDQGFEVFFGHNAYQIPSNRDPVNLYRGRRPAGPQRGYTADLYVSEALAWLAARDARRPFFLTLSMAEPHTTIANPPAWNARYARFTRGEAVPIPSGLPEPPLSLLVPRGPGEYYANVSYLDDQLGRLLAWLQDAGLAGETVVAFVSDNGPVTADWFQWHEVNAHGSTGGLRGRKHMLYEGGIRVPALLRVPGLTEPGSSRGGAVTGLDLFNTLAALAGAEVPDDRPLDGADLSAWLAGGTLPERTLLWSLQVRGELAHAVRRGPWKLLLDGRGEPRELYHLGSDPLELVNRLSAEPAQVEALRGAFARHLRSIHDDPLRPLAGPSRPE